jgi:hypothetical protein
MKRNGGVYTRKVDDVHVDPRRSSRGCQLSSLRGPQANMEGVCRSLPLSTVPQALISAPGSRMSYQRKVFISVKEEGFGRSYERHPVQEAAAIEPVCPHPPETPKSALSQSAERPQLVDPRLWRSILWGALEGTLGAAESRPCDAAQRADESRQGGLPARRTRHEEDGESFG